MLPRSPTPTPCRGGDALGFAARGAFLLQYLTARRALPPFGFSLCRVSFRLTQFDKHVGRGLTHCAAFVGNFVGN
jgi:hypothetical protein